MLNILSLVLVLILPVIIILYRGGFIHFSPGIIFLIKLIYASMGAFFVALLGLYALAYIEKIFLCPSYADVFCGVTLGLLGFASGAVVGIFGIFRLLTYLFYKSLEAGEGTPEKSEISVQYFVLALLGAFLGGVGFSWFIIWLAEILNLVHYLDFGFGVSIQVLIVDILATIIVFVFLLKFFKKISERK